MIETQTRVPDASLDCYAEIYPNANNHIKNHSI